MIKNKTYPYYHDEEYSTLRQHLKRCIDKFPDNVAFSYEKEKKYTEKTYLEFNNETIQLANMLSIKDWKKEKIAILGENSYEWILSYFAIANSDNIVVPIDKELDIKEVENILFDTDAKLIFYSDTYSDYAEIIKKDIDNIELINMKDILGKLIKERYIDEEAIKQYEKINVDDQDIIEIIFTSGTTGKPKGVVLTHKNICSDVISGMKSLKLRGNTILTLPLHHTYSFTAAVLTVMFSGCNNYINKSLKNLNIDILNQKPNFIYMVPLMIETLYKKIWKLAKDNRKDKILKLLIKLSNVLLICNIDIRRKLFKSIINEFGGNLEFIVSGGADLDKKYQKAFYEIGINIFAGYGITECSPFVSVNRNNHFKHGSVGQPMSGVKVKIDFGENEKSGEICLKGDMLMKGYYNNDELTKEVIDQEGFFKTGDIGYLDQDGFIFITGRKKNVIILSNGKNVYPEKIETILLENDVIQEIIVREGEKNNIMAEIFPNYDYLKENNIGNIKEFLQSKIDAYNKSQPLYSNISEIEIRDKEFEKTSTKKIKRIYKNII